MCYFAFDDIEEFAMDRKLPSLSMESRMLTTAMLAATNGLRKKEQSIISVLPPIDWMPLSHSAVTGPGRVESI